MLTSLKVPVIVDSEANAATIVLNETARGRGLRTIPVWKDGEVAATLTFAPDGGLVEIELLDAAVQLSALMPH